MREIDPSTIPTGEAHRYLLSCVAPRPIAFVGTVDAEGRDNLAPFSFFNAFGANPPVVAFSPAYRGADGTAKHTFLNAKENGEFTVSLVSYSMVQQMSLSSSDFELGVDEFVKAGFTKLPSKKIAPPGVLESPMVMECKLLQHVDLGGKPGSGNLMIGEVVMFHIKESVFDGKYPHHDRLDLVARMGGPYYCRASGSAVFELPKPSGVGIGFDSLPDSLLRSTVLTGNELALLAGVESIPLEAKAIEFWEEMRKQSEEIKVDDVEIEFRSGDLGRAAIALITDLPRKTEEEIQMLSHRYASVCLKEGNVEWAWWSLLGLAYLTKEAV